MAVISGTFAGTGTSATISGNTIQILMDFGASASVDVEVQMPGSGNWIKAVTGITTDYAQVYQANGINLRLNCTALSNNVEYALISTSP